MKVSIELTLPDISNALIDRYGPLARGEYETTVSFLTDKGGNVVGAVLIRTPLPVTSGG